MMRHANAAYLLAGVAVGGAAGLLFAPRTGCEMQEYLQTKGRPVADALIRHGNNLFDCAIPAIKDGRRVVQDELETLSDPVERGKRAYLRRLQRIESVSTTLPKRFRRAVRMAV